VIKLFLSFSFFFFSDYFFLLSLLLFTPGTPFPPHLTLLCQRHDGGMVGLGLNIRETFAHLREACELSQRGDLAGPRKAVKEIVTHPSEAHPFVATISESGELDIWFKSPELVRFLPLCYAHTTKTQQPPNVSSQPRDDTPFCNLVPLFPRKIRDPSLW